MPLAALQRDFRAAIAGAAAGASDGAAAIESAVRPDALGAARRVAIYRNAVRSNWRGALQAVYPVIFKLVGAAFFNEAANRYAESHPSTSGDLHDFGGKFGDFLAAYPHAERLPYLPDMARLEWALHESFHALDVEPVVLARLAAVPPDAYGNLAFRVAPSVKLLDTAWPIFAIWEANQREGDLPPDFELEGGGDWLMVRRDGFDAVVELLDHADFEFLSAGHAGETLAQAVERPGIASLDDPGAYLLAALQRFVPAGVLYDFTLVDTDSADGMAATKQMP